MADYQIRNASVFISGRKMGQFTGGTLSIASGDEPNFGDNGGSIVYSNGVIQPKLKMNVFEPIQGLDFDLDGALLSKTNLQISVGLINGKIYSANWRPLESSHTTEVKDGKSVGDYDFGATSLLTRQ